MPWQAIAWRLATWDTPWWAAPNGRAARFNRAAGSPTQYLCLHPWGPWAEVLRWEHRTTAVDARELRGRIWSVRVTLPAPPRSIDFDNAAVLGVAPEDLVADDYAVCQDLADDFRRNNDGALTAPSAALPGTRTLVLFGARALNPWQLDPIDVDIDVPAAVTADDAGPPLALLPYVRWRGSRHLELDAWRAGDSAPFLEPVPTPL